MVQKTISKAKKNKQQDLKYRILVKWENKKKTCFFSIHWKLDTRVNFSNETYFVMKRKKGFISLRDFFTTSKHCWQLFCGYDSCRCYFYHLKISMIKKNNKNSRKKLRENLIRILNQNEFEKIIIKFDRYTKKNKSKWKKVEAIISMSDVNIIQFI